MKITMNNVEYEIKEVDQKEYKKYRKEEDETLECEITNTATGIWYGATHSYPNIIFIDKNLHNDKKKKTLIHELTHCYISEYMTHEENKYTEENVADISANSHDIIHEIIKEYFKEK